MGSIPTRLTLQDDVSPRQFSAGCTTPRLTSSLIGSTLGLLGAFGVSRLLTASFPGIQTSSVPALIGATVLLITIAQVASYLPARTASRISPTEALRAE